MQPASPEPTESVPKAASAGSVTSLPDSAVCLHCGYSLRALTEPRCPECGRGFVVSDVLTWHDRNWSGRWTRRLLVWSIPPRMWEVFAVAASTVFLLYRLDGIRSTVEREAMSGLLALEAAALLGTISLLRLVLVRLARRRCLARASKSSEWRWWVIPLCAGVLVLPWLLPIQYWKLEIICAVNQRAMETRALQVQQSGGAAHLAVPGFGTLRVAALGDGRVKFDLGRALLMYDPAGRSPSRIYHRLWLAPRWCYRELGFR